MCCSQGKQDEFDSTTTDRIEQTWRFGAGFSSACGFLGIYQKEQEKEAESVVGATLQKDEKT